MGSREGWFKNEERMGTEMTGREPWVGGIHVTAMRRKKLIRDEG